MSRTRDIFGMDGKEIAIYVIRAGVVVMLVSHVGRYFNYDGEGVATLVAAGAAALLGLRIFRARRNRPTTLAAGGQAELEGLDERLYQLEQEQARIHELEERVDFAERMLVSEREKRAQIEEGR